MTQTNSEHIYEPVLPVAEVVALEQRIAAEGTSLKELMARAGKALTLCVLETCAESDIAIHAPAITNENFQSQLTSTKTRVQTASNIANKAVIFTGSGNNGGDGWVVASLLAKENWNVVIVCSKPAEELKAEPARETALEIIQNWKDSGVFNEATDQNENTSLYNESATQSASIEFNKDSTIQSKTDALLNNSFCNEEAKHEGSVAILVSPSSEQLKEELTSACVVVDGILGTGFTGTSIKEPYASWIMLSNQEKQQRLENRVFNNGANSLGSAANSETTTSLNNTSLITIAADVPSGLSANTGSIANPCFRADKTVTMLAYKPGLILPESQQWTGQLILAPLV